MHQESSWITKCSTPASWSLIIFVCPLLLRWLFQRFPLTAAAKWARLKVTDWEYVFKCIYKCIYRFPFLLHFSLPLTDDKITHLQFKLQHTWLFWKKKEKKKYCSPLSLTFHRISHIISLLAHPRSWFDKGLSQSQWSSSLTISLSSQQKYFPHHSLPI